jgi:hemerythrin-like domain-containing protein
MTAALRIIRDEHRTISAVLHALKDLARAAQDPGAKPAFAALRAMVRYIDEFPEKLHHPKEDDHLFARVVSRVPDARRLVDDLRQEHLEGVRLVRELERALVFFEDRAPEGAREFLDAVNAYAEFHWQHMRKEEQELLPLAERHLTAQDWKSIDAAFTENPDFEKQFTRIVNLAPEPVGLGARS